MYAVIMPSHTSTLHQAPDCGLNAGLDIAYSARYSAGIAAAPTSSLSIAQRVKWLAQSVKDTAQNDALIRKGWYRTGLTTAVKVQGRQGYATLVTDPFTKVTKYELGETFRQAPLLPITGPLLTQLFSRENLALPFESTHLLDVAKVTESNSRTLAFRQAIVDGTLSYVEGTSFTKYHIVRVGRRDDTVHSMAFTALGSSAATRASALLGRATAVPVIDEETNEVVSTGTRSTRVATAGGLFLSARAHHSRMTEIAAARAQQAAESAQRAAEAEAALEREAPVRRRLTELGFLGEQDKLTVGPIKQFLSHNRHARWGSHGPPRRNDKREDLVDALLTAFSQLPAIEFACKDEPAPEAPVRASIPPRLEPAPSPPCIADVSSSVVDEASSAGSVAVVQRCSALAEGDNERGGDEGGPVQGQEVAAAVEQPRARDSKRRRLASQSSCDVRPVSARRLAILSRDRQSAGQLFRAAQALTH